MDFINKVLDWIKLSPKYLAGIAIFAGLLLFIPEPIAETLGLAAIIATYRPWIGIALLLTFSLLVVHAINPLVDYGRKKWRWHTNRQRLQQRLHHLTSEEKAILRGYILKGTRTQYLRPDDGVVSGLESATILYQASAMGGAGFSFLWAYNIQPWAWDYLYQKQELIMEGDNELYDPDSMLDRQRE